MAVGSRHVVSRSLTWTILTSPALLLLVKLTLVIFLTETAITLILGLPFAGTTLEQLLISLDDSGLTVAVVDSSLLVLLSAPVVYFWIFSPYVTKHTAAEAALRESEDSLARAQRQARIGSWRWSVTRNALVSCSEEYARIHGVDINEIEDHLAHQLERVIHPGDREMVEAEFKRFDEEGLDYEIEYRIIRPDGEVCQVLEIGEVVLDKTGQAVEQTGTLQDITERKRAEEEVRRFKTTLDQTLDCVFMFDPDTLKFIYVNEGALEQVGYSADELKDMTPLDIKPEIDESRFRAMLAPMIAQEKRSTTFETLHEHKNGHLIPVEVFLQHVVAREDESRFVAIVRDITDRKRAEEVLEESKRALQARIVKLEEVQCKLEQQGAELLQVAGDLKIARDEAEAANRTKSEFLAAMSHELRTPLNAVIGFSEMIKGEMLGPVGSPQYRGYASDIYGAGRHLLSLINDILDLSKVESGVDDLHEESIEVPELVQSVVRLVRQRAENGSVTLQLDIRDDLPLLIADERKLKQILANLLSNAVKFTNPGGQVTLKTWCRPDSGFVFQVVDTGIGIAPEDIPKALSQFGQIDSGLNRKHEGTGLGLPLTKNLVELQGGSLDLQSQLGVGTTVTVRLPAARIVWPAGDAGRSAEDGRAAS